MGLEQMPIDSLEGRINEDELKKQREKYIETAIKNAMGKGRIPEFIFKRSTRQQLAETGSDDTIDQVTDYVFEQLLRDHGIKAESSEKSRQEIVDAYPMKIVRNKVKNWIETEVYKKK